MLSNLAIAGCVCRAPGHVSLTGLPPRRGHKARVEGSTKTKHAGAAGKVALADALGVHGAVPNRHHKARLRVQRLVFQKTLARSRKATSRLHFC